MYVVWWMVCLKEMNGDFESSNISFPYRILKTISTNPLLNRMKSKILHTFYHGRLTAKSGKFVSKASVSGPSNFSSNLANQVTCQPCCMYLVEEQKRDPETAPWVRRKLLLLPRGLEAAPPGQTMALPLLATDNKETFECKIQCNISYTVVTSTWRGMDTATMFEQFCENLHQPRWFNFPKCSIQNNR